MKKKLLSVVLGLAMAVSLAACAGGDGKEGTAEQDTGVSDTAADPESISAEISLWCYQVGKWGNQEETQKLIDAFNQKYPNITVNLQCLEYKDGDAKVQEAIDAGSPPDIVMEGPERLVSNWGAAGLLVNLNDMWTDEVVADIAENNVAVLAACQGVDGNYYEYPLCMNAHCMAVNKEVFEAAGAMQYIDDATRTWTTDDFEKAMQALKAYGVQTTGIVYCGGQGGDQGTRALAMNLYSAQFTNGAHTKWLMDSDNGIKGISKLAEWCSTGLLTSDPTIVAADELKKFAAGEAAMTFCWNASNRTNYAENVNFTPYAVTFPSDDGVPELAGGIYGFAVFDSKDAERIAAAKIFIDYMCNDEAQAPMSVRASGFFPVRASLSSVYQGTEQEAVMTEFASMMPYLGDYYNVIPGWAEQRTAWWNMLQQVFAGADVKQAVTEYAASSNATTLEVLKSFQ